MRSFLRKISTLILSLAIALCFIPCLTADTAVGVGSSNNATEKETIAQTSRTNSEVEREVVKDQPAEIDTALKETEGV